ncbi:gliding motility protein GldM [Mucilaginibacter sp. BJC16-A38]|uniref:type IX secretion system motor protein PorM/GldM n=1 Tax=Mucilaginibacter phenanthrenivorans TaxID=1234842 RepID=UPI002157F70D|nr:gliding motility protein GldM [Mucilaginibacter phenanthrenivorans]MCR8558674.1 gliding motility protein GldM [Mucilaginibacter phenanthrenivorans]
MAGGKQTPRQRMIGILYLVLLGLIALDVPESLLDAFKNISDSLSASKTNVQSGIDNTFKTFENGKLKEQPERAAPIYARAKKARDLSDALDKYIDSLKKVMVDESGGMDEATGDYSGRESLDESVDLMVDRRKYAFELHKKIDATREGLVNLLDPKDRAGVNLALQANAPLPRRGFPTKNWEEANFGEGIPMGAAMTAFTKIQSDTKNAENEVVKKILVEVDKAQVNLDHFDAVAVAPTSYVLVGQTYTADVFLTAYDSKLSPTITVGGSPLPTESGKGKYTGNTSSEGLKTWSATINVKQTDGTIKTYTTPTQSYMVAKPSAVVSPDKMNVLYIGVPNPVSVSAPGIAKSDLRVSMSSGSLSGSDGHYTATVNSIGTATINVSGMVSGKLTNLGSTLFRTKRIPDPKPQFAGKSSGNTSAANLRAQDRLFAKLEGFDFDAKFTVTRFALQIAKPRQDVVTFSTTGADLSSAMRSAMSTVSPGTTVVFKDIIAVGPDGTQRGLDAIVLIAN